MSSIPSDKEYRAVETILKESGLGVRDLRGGQYDAMVDAMIYGDPITISKGSDGKADVTVGGVDATSPIFRNVNRPEDCPPQIPAALCGGYSAVASGMKKITTPIGSAVETATDYLSPDKWETYGFRISLVFLGILLVVVGTAVMLWEPTRKVVTTGAKIAAKAVV